MHFLLFYDLAPDYLERRAALREEHLSLAWQAHDRGELVLGGALTDPVDTSLLLFRADTPAAAEAAIKAFVAADPYVRHGLVRSWCIRPWTTVAGKDAATPLRP